MKPEQLLTVDPKTLAERAKGLELFGAVEEVERALERSRAPADSEGVPFFLREAAECAEANAPAQPASSHRRFVGPLIASSKRLFRATFQPFINELLRTQVTYNRSIVDALTLIHERLERNAVSERRWRTEMEKRLDALERAGEKGD